MISPTPLFPPKPSVPPQDSHVPVLLKEVVEGLAVVPGETLVDEDGDVGRGSGGRGGHGAIPFSSSR